MTHVSPAPLIGNTTVQLTAVPYTHPEARRLTTALHAEQVATYGYADDPLETPPDHFDVPRGLFVIAHLEGHPHALGCGGWRMTAPGTAEIKRMYVHPDARRLSLGSQILHFLEQRAQSHGALRAILETGNRNTAALALYERFSYQPIPSYVPGRQPSVNRAMAKDLTEATTPYNQPNNISTGTQ
jgi:GNAT superfamily N-acetyltransferase